MPRGSPGQNFLSRKIKNGEVRGQSKPNIMWSGALFSDKNNQK